MSAGPSLPSFESPCAPGRPAPPPPIWFIIFRSIGSFILQRDGSSVVTFDDKGKRNKNLHRAHIWHSSSSLSSTHLFIAMSASRYENEGTINEPFAES